MVCWLALAVAAAFTRRFARAKRLTPFVYVTLALGLVHALMLTPFVPTNTTPYVMMGELFLTRGSLPLALCAAAWIAVGALERARLPALVHAGVGCACLGLAVVNERTPPEWIAGAWLVIALGVAFSQAVTRRLPLTRVALVVLLPVFAMWVYAYLVVEDWLLSSAPIAAHAGFLMSLAIVGAAGALAYANQRRGDCRSRASRLSWIVAPIGVGALVLLLSTSLEVVRAADVFAQSEQMQRAALSIWWALFAVPVLVVGFAKQIASARIAALLLIVLASIKALVYDLFQVEAALRVVVFLALGLLMMAIALVYARATRRSREAEVKVAATPPEADEPAPQSQE